MRIRNGCGAGALLFIGGLGWNTGCSSDSGGDSSAGMDVPESTVKVNYLIDENDELFLFDKVVPVDAASEEILKLEAREDVISASVYVPVEAFSGEPPNDPKFPTNEWAFGATGIYLPTVTDAWNVTSGGGAMVAVLDSGIGKNQDLNVAGGWSVANVNAARAAKEEPSTDYAEYKPDSKHGTMVAGVLSAIKNNGHAVAGGAPDAALIAIRSSDDSGGNFTAGILQVAYAERYGLDYPVQTVNISQGFEESKAGAPAVMVAAVEAALQSGVLLVAAVGNSAEKGSPITYPAAIPGVLGVGSVDNQPGLPVSKFSQRGFFVDMVAPGDSIVTTDTPLFQRYPTTTVSGTSFAAPFVSAAATLLMAHGKENCRLKGSVDEKRDCVVRYKRRLQGTALADGDEWTPEKGAGVLQAHMALAVPEADIEAPMPPSGYSASGHSNDPKVARTEVALRWSKPSAGKADGYVVYRDGKRIATVSGTSHTDQLAEPLQGDILYQVTAINSRWGESSPARLWRCFLQHELTFDADDNEILNPEYECRQEDYH